jgi:Periplasmic binding protein
MSEGLLNETREGRHGFKDGRRCAEREPFCLSCIRGRYHQDCPIDPLSGGGASIGESALKTFQYLVDELNANGGLNGKRVEFVGFDNKLDPQISLVQAQKAADQGFRIVTQGAGSSVAAALSDGSPNITIAIRGSRSFISILGPLIRR